MVDISDVTPLAAVVGAVVTSVAAYKGVLLTTLTSVRTSAATRQHEALGELLGAVTKIQRSSAADISGARAEFRSAYELVQRTAPEPSDILGIADEINEAVSVVGRTNGGAENVLQSVLSCLRVNAAHDDEELEQAGYLGRRHSREILDVVLVLHSEQDAALAEGRPDPDVSKARTVLLEDDWDEAVVDEFLAYGARKRARIEKAVSARLEARRQAYEDLANAKSRLIEAERLWVNNPTLPSARYRKVPRYLKSRRRP